MDDLGVRGNDVRIMNTPGKAIAGVMQETADERPDLGWHVGYEIFFQAALSIIHGHQGNTIAEIIVNGKECWDRKHSFFAQDRQFHYLHSMDMHPTADEKASSKVKFAKLNFRNRKLKTRDRKSD